MLAFALFTGNFRARNCPGAHFKALDAGELTAPGTPRIWPLLLCCAKGTLPGATPRILATAAQTGGSDVRRIAADLQIAPLAALFAAEIYAEDAAAVPRGHFRTAG